MKRAAFITSAVFSLLNFHAVHAADTKYRQIPKKDSSQSNVQAKSFIRVSDGAWGNAAPWQIEIVLNAVATEMLAHFPGQKLEPIVVSPSQHGPVVLYQKGPQHEYQILLAAKDQRWAEYVYEFSHELFHVLARYEYHAMPDSARHQWFEEMLCETVSLYMLKRFSLTWEDAPPLPEWRAYAPTMQAFTHRALSEQHRQLPANVSFEQWFQQNGPALASQPYLREKNELVASIFLPFLANKRDWRAVSYLNLDRTGRNSSFYDFLSRWYTATPPAQQRFVADAMQLFRFKPPDSLEHAKADESATLPSASSMGPTQGPAGASRH